MGWRDAPVVESWQNAPEVSAPAFTAAPEVPVPVQADQIPASRAQAPEQPASRAPAWAQEYPNLYKGLVATRQLAGPTLEMLGGIGGAAVGTVGAPGLGTLAGAGAGYAGARQILRLADTYLGTQPAMTPDEALKQATFDIAAGGAMEAGGRVVGQAVSAGLGRLADARQIPQQRAAALARESLGENLDAAQLALQTAPPGSTAAQALAGSDDLYIPTTQALLQRAAARAPERFGPITGPQAGITPVQRREAINQLAELAGGRTPVAAQAAREADINALNQQLLPERDVVLAGINAQEAARQQAQRMAMRPNDPAGQKLNIKTIEQQITANLNASNYAGNRQVKQVLGRVLDDIKEATDETGAIDAVSLDAIRRNSINNAVIELYGASMNPNAQKQLAAGLLTKLKPTIDNAINTAAGNTKYTEYLDAYAKGRQAVEQRQLSAEALEMFERNPKEFVDLVTGRSPEKVKEIFGPGNYDLVKQMSESAMSTLSKIGETAGRAVRATEQAAAGREAYNELLKDYLAKIRVPWGLSASGAALNKGIDTLEKKIARKTWQQLTKSAQTAESFDELLRTLPAFERTKVLKIIRDPASYGLAKGATARALAEPVLNELAPESENRNALMGGM